MRCNSKHINCVTLIVILLQRIIKILSVNIKGYLSVSKLGLILVSGNVCKICKETAIPSLMMLLIGRFS